MRPRGLIGVTVLGVGGLGGEPTCEESLESLDRLPVPPVVLVVVCLGGESNL